MYEIVFDERNRILKQRCAGIWDLAEVKRFHVELEATLTRLKSKYTTWSVLADTRDCTLVTKEVAGAFAEFMSSEIAQPNGRVAVLVSAVLNKLQAQRVTNNPLIAVFMDESEALAWLATPINA